MKREDLIREISALGGRFVRHGARHDWYEQPVTGEHQAVPRHREINERLARAILRRLSVPTSPH